MKKLLLLFLLSIAFSCSKTDDDTRDSCTMNCTTLSGHFLTAYNQPISGVEVSFDYRIGSELGSYTRKIAKTKTNSKGEYSVDFYLKDKELGNAPGYFTISVSDKNLDPNRYIRLDDNGGLGYAIYKIQNRDTIIDNSFYIPKKAFIKVNLNGFMPSQPDDFFEVETLYPQGPKGNELNILNSFYSIGFSPFQLYRAKTKNQQFNVIVAEGEKNLIRMSKRKNGVTSVYETTIVYVPEKNTIELTYNF